MSPLFLASLVGVFMTLMLLAMSQKMPLPRSQLNEISPTALLLAGCSSSSPLIPSIFLINLWYDRTAPQFDPAQVDPGASRAIGNIVGNAQLEARVGWVKSHQFVKSTTIKTDFCPNFIATLGFVLILTDLHGYAAPTPLHSLPK